MSSIIIESVSFISKYVKTEQPELSYLYNRVHSTAYPEAFKNGSTDSILERNQQYKTGEFRPGKFRDVYQCDGTMGNRKLAEWIERNLHEHLRMNCGAHLYHEGGGSEFFDIDKIRHVDIFIEDMRKQHGFDIIKLTDQQITELLQHRNSQAHPVYIPNPTQEVLPGSVRMTSLVQSSIQSSGVPVPREYQREIIEATVSHLHNHGKGILEIPCGVGKTYIALWVGKELCETTVLVGVPNTQLLNQWKDRVETLFPDRPILVVSGNITPAKIRAFLAKHTGQQYTVITTYASSDKVLNATIELGGVWFGLKINDEVHHLTTGNEAYSQEKDRKTYIKILSIMAKNTLSLTATLKIRDETSSKQIGNTITNDDVAHFGEVIQKRNVHWAISNGIICDYVIQILNVVDTRLDYIFESLGITDYNDKRLCLSAYSALLSKQKGVSHHSLVYCNSKRSSAIIVSFICEFIAKGYFNIDGLYYAEYNSDQAEAVQQKILADFESAPVGIIVCVYCLGEGYDFPLLDMVIFAENMSSTIRIVQSALRASRKDPAHPEKRTKIVLPVLEMDEYIDNTQTPDFQKVREVIRQMGMEDETIMQKLSVINVNPSPDPPLPPSPQPTPSPTLGEFNVGLTNKLRLKTISRDLFGIMGYDKAKTVIANRNIRTKEEYTHLCLQNVHLPTDPKETYGDKFKSWVDYLSISRDDYYSIAECKTKVREYVAAHPELKQSCSLDISTICTKLTEMDERFPSNGMWVDIYGIRDLAEIIDLTPKKKQMILL
jgi:superfamily II DNA or RNA helicase